MSKFDMVDAVMSYFDKYQFSGSHNYKDVLAIFEQITDDCYNSKGAFKDCDNLFDYNEFAKELYERDKTCKDIRSALAALFIDSQSCSYRVNLSTPCRARRPCSSGLVHRASSMSALRDSPSTLRFTTLDVLSKIKPL